MADTQRVVEQNTCYRCRIDAHKRRKFSHPQRAIEERALHFGVDVDAVIAQLRVHLIYIAVLPDDIVRNFRCVDGLGKTLGRTGPAVEGIETAQQNLRIGVTTGLTDQSAGGLPAHSGCLPVIADVAAGKG